MVPSGPGLTLRPMFGQLSAFVNGNMFAGVFGDAMFVRLPDDQRALVLKAGGGDFEPMPGRPMKGYVSLPPAWKDEVVRAWMSKSMDWVREMPPKAPGARKKK